MKVTLIRNLLESVLARCFEATEKRASDSTCQMAFSGNTLTICTRGSYTWFEEKMHGLNIDEDCVFSIKTSTMLEFVKHVNSEQLIISYDDNKKSCVVSSVDKKSRIAFQTIDLSIEQIDSKEEYLVNVKNPSEFFAKLGYASRFCSSDYQHYPLTHIHCDFSEKGLQIQTTNGLIYYNSFIENPSEATFQFYLPRGIPQIAKNIFGEGKLKQISLSSKCIIFKSEELTLLVNIDTTEKEFSQDIPLWITKPENASMKISVSELLHAMKLFNSVLSECPVQFSLSDTKVELVVKDTAFAAKESINPESLSGKANSTYNCKLFLSCLDVLTSSWVNMKFINLENSELSICVFDCPNTTVMLCPTIV